MDLVGLLIAILIVALVWWLCTAIGLPWIVSVVITVLVVLATFGRFARR